jgi:hypothetical protein
MTCTICGYAAIETMTDDETCSNCGFQFPKPKRAIVYPRIKRSKEWYEEMRDSATELASDMVRLAEQYPDSEAVKWGYRFWNEKAELCDERVHDE